ncbi:MAG: class I SAM-dependent methyltransferase, partial [Chloroflexota bacterium]|nr:class I SAM-dependent methyltransferase [Chloroflexota bacterium]
MDDERITEAGIAAHDRQRSLPAEAERAMIEGLRVRLAGRGRCLDAGVGTGAVALPLARAGIPLVGLDRSRAMLGALVAKGDGGPPFPLVRGDLVRLPFVDGAFGAAVAANVFHLIAAWREATAELVRVVGPGGLLLVNLG